MPILTLQIEDSKFEAFLEFIKTLDYVEIRERDNAFLSDLYHSLDQVKQMKEGKLPHSSIDSLLNEPED